MNKPTASARRSARSSIRYESWLADHATAQVSVMRARVKPLFVLMYIAAFSGATTAQTIDQQRCFGLGSVTPSTEDRVRGCTSIIQTGQETPEILAKAFNNRGLAYASKGEFDRAIQDYDQAIRLDASYAMAFNNRGIAYASKDEFDRAIQDYDQAIRLNASFAWAFNNRGLAYASKGKFDRAIQDYDQAIRLDANFVDAFNNRINAKLAKGDFAGGVTDLGKAALQGVHGLSGVFEFLLSLAALSYIVFKLVGLSAFFDLYFNARFVKNSNFRRWSVPFSHLKNPERARALDTEHLFWCLKLGPTFDAKSLIFAELHRRAFSDSQIFNWMPLAPQITSISSALVPSSTAQYRQLGRHRKRFFWIYRLFAFPIFILAIFSSITINDLPVLPEAETAGEVLIYLMIFVSFIAVLAGRKRSLRILLLRPFGKPKISSPLRRLVIKYLGPIATIYTLSDKSYQPGRFLAAFERSTDLWRTAVGALYRPSRLLMDVRNERTFLNLARTLGRGIGPSLRTFVVGDQALRINSTDDIWQITTDMLMLSVDLIVMDVSDIGIGGGWEISQLSKRGLEKKCMFMCQEDYDRRGLSSLRQVYRDFDLQRLHIYTASGRFKDVSRFDSEMNTLLDQALQCRRNIRGTHL